MLLYEVLRTIIPIRWLIIIYFSFGIAKRFSFGSASEALILSTIFTADFSGVIYFSKYFGRMLINNVFC